MTRFKQSIEQGYVKLIPSDRIKAKSLAKSADEAVYSAKKIPLEPHTLKSIIRELYEGLRQFCESIGYIQGYKFLSHEAITYFIEEVLSEPKLSAKFDRYRKIRNGINYYGDDVSEETVNEALTEIPELIAQLRKHVKNHKLQ